MYHGCLNSKPESFFYYKGRRINNNGIAGVCGMRKASALAQKKLKKKNKQKRGEKKKGINLGKVNFR